MKKLNTNQYRALTTNAKVIEKDAFGEKVLLLDGGNYLKLFRVKRLISSARFYPYSRRFVDNAAMLQKLGIPTLNVISEYKIPFLKRTAVHYSPLPGDTLRSNAIIFNEEFSYKLGQFISALHNKGVYFRSLHFGNIILTPEKQLGLIDIADMKIYRKPLDKNLRIRNFKHLSRYGNDCEALQLCISKLIQGYMKNNPDEEVSKAILQQLTTP